MKLFLIHHAGGSSISYQKWLKYLKTTENIMIELPGHFLRSDEPLINSFGEAVQEVSKQITTRLDRDEKFMVFGHSMGALLAYYATHSLSKTHQTTCLFLSGASSPDTMQNSITHISWINDDKAFISEVVKFGGMSEEMLNSKELIELSTPVLRADFSIMDSFIFQPSEPIGCRGYVLNGIDDVDTAKSAHRWSSFFKSGVTVRMFPGNHFYINDAFKDICDFITKVAHSYCRNTSNEKAKDIAYAVLQPKLYCR